MKVYQILNVSSTLGENFIIPDAFVYRFYQDAMENLEKRMAYFEDNKENCSYKGKINSIEEIQNQIYTECITSYDHTDFYIYEMEVI